MLNFQFIIITFWSYGFSCLDYIMVSMQSKSNHVVLESVIDDRMFFFRMRIFIIQIKIYSFF